ncbi:MAG: preprotein translocase subunit SecY [Acidimicrobiales bacterium]
METLRNVLRTTELRNKILFTIFIIALYRLGAQIPAPGVSLDGIEELRQRADENQGGVFGYLTLFTGSGGVLNLFGLGILPYITSSIVIQILTVAVPKLEEWQSQGAVGQRKITQWTRYIAVVLALIQSASLTFLINRSPEQIFGYDPGLFPDGSIGRMLLAIMCVTVGTSILMWMGELVTEKGIGNGMSVLIFASVVSNLPVLGYQIYQIRSWVWVVIALLVLVGLCVGIVFIEQGQRRIPINFPKRVVGRKQYGGNKTYIPLKVNQAGVIPVIFASSLLQLPSLIATSLPTSGNELDPNWGDNVREFIQNRLFRPTDPAYLIVFGLLIIGFAYFYNAIAFDPARRADELRKSGGFITGVRPGPQTERYLSKVLNRITLPGSLFLAAIALIPSALLFQLLGSGGNNVGLLGFSGISILIGVGVSLELMKQINSQLMARNYEGFLK